MAKLPEGFIYFDVETMIEELSTDYSQQELTEILFLDIYPEVKLWILDQLEDTDVIKDYLIRSRDEWISQQLITKITEQSDFIELYLQSSDVLMYLLLDRLSQESLKTIVMQEVDINRRKFAIFSITDKNFLQTLLNKIQDDPDTDILMKQTNKMDITMILGWLADLEAAIELRIEQLEAD